MKIDPRRADAFATAPDPTARVVLVYGPDGGLVRERVVELIHAAVSDPQDPFLVAELTADQLRSDPARLVDEAAAMALTGGKRAVHVRQATDGLAKVVGGFLDDPAGDATVILEAADLGPRSTLRRLVEQADNGAAIACYADDAQALDRVIHATLRRDGIAADPDAAVYLSANLGVDRGISRSELEKLALYVGPGGKATLDDVAAVIGDSSAMSLDTLVLAAADGAIAEADHALMRVYAEGVQPVAVLRGLGRHLLRLQLVRARHEMGQPLDSALKSLRPPVFFKLVGQFRRQATIWNLPRLGQALALTLTAERDCKRTDMPAEAICGRALLQISHLAGIGRRRA